MKPKPEDSKKSWIFAVIAALIVITFMSLYFGSGPQVGKAVTIGSEPWSGTAAVELEQEEMINFTVLPPERQAATVRFRVGTSGNPPPGIQEYSFTLENLGGMLYKYTISTSPPSTSPTNVVVSDLLYSGGTMDVSEVYLNDFDAHPDLQVMYRNGQVVIRNSHYFSPDSAKIVLRNVSIRNLDAERIFFPSVIRMSTSTAATPQTVRILINASSSKVAPDKIGVSFVEALDETPRSRILGLNTADNAVNPGYAPTTSNMAQNYTFSEITYTAPSVDGAEILSFNASVRGQVSKAYYIFAIGDVIYALRDSGFPRQTLSFDPLLAAGETKLNLNLLPTTNLQPLALPCSNESNFNILFAEKPVKRVYSYRDGAVQVWTNQSPANDFTNFSSFQGYFVELSEAVTTAIPIICKKTTLLEPFSTAPPEVAGTLPPPVTVPRGWSLFSLPGIVPHPFNYFLPDTGLRLFECSQGYTCREISTQSALKPGKPYWIYTDAPLTFRYSIREVR